MALASRLAAAACLGAAALGAWAQQTSLGPSDAVACLGPADIVAKGPDYDFELWKGELAGRVTVQAEFTAPDRAPAIEVTAREGDERFVAAVRRHVAQWRVPCMPAGAAPVRLSREYVFQPMSQRPVQGPVRDAADALRADLLRCLRNVQGEERPAYPREALRMGLQGRVFVEARFTAPDRPPEFRVFARSGAQLLTGAVTDWLAHWRMPCLSGEAVNTTARFAFRIDGDPAFGFKPLTLLQFLSRAKGAEQLRFQADTRTMGCPFELRLLYLQPQAPNRVRSVTGDRAEREPLLQLLRGVELALPERALDSVFADETMITVPCSTFDLKPQGDKS